MAKYKESSKTSTVETDEPDPKVLKLTASVDLEDHSTEDIHIPQADISSAEEECSIECSMQLLSVQARKLAVAK